METENREITLTELENMFNQAIGFGANYIGVKIQRIGFDKPEIIIDPKENFETKLDYYKLMYNDDLTMKTCKQIKIVAFVYGETFAELRDWLIG